jgi:hypothetical protein
MSEYFWMWCAVFAYRTSRGTSFSRPRPSNCILWEHLCTPGGGGGPPGDLFKNPLAGCAGTLLVIPVWGRIEQRAINDADNRIGTRHEASRTWFFRTA